MSDGNSRGTKRHRIDGPPPQTAATATDVRLSGRLRELVGSKYTKLESLGKEVLVRYLKERGDIIEVELMKVHVEPWGGCGGDARSCFEKNTWTKGNNSGCNI